MSKAIAASIFLLLVCSTRPAAAQSARASEVEQRPRLALYSERRQQIADAPVLSSSLELDVSGLLARGSFTVSFANPTDEWMQGVYLFPLPENAAVHGLRMVIGERVVEGEIAEREAAERGYHAALHAGREAALLSQERPNVFMARVGNVGPHETAVISIDLDMEVRYWGGRFTLRFPTVVGSRYSPQERCAPELAAAGKEAAPQALSMPLPEMAVPRVSPALDTSPGSDLSWGGEPVTPAGPVNPLAVHVELEAGVPLVELTSPSHLLRVERRSASSYVVELDGGAAPADRDFVLEWAPAPERAPRAALYVQERGGERFALVMLVPPVGRSGEENAALPRETIYVIDTSGSMEGVSIEQARRALLFGLDRLRPGDRFNVIRFASDLETLFPDSAAAVPAALEQARAFVRGLRAGGGTEMLPALRAALLPGGGPRAAGELVRQVVFVTDGGVDNEADLFAYIRKYLDASRLYTVGIGPTPNNHFLRKAAELGRGNFTSIDRVDQVEAGMTALISAIESPVLHDITLRWSDPAAESWPRLPPDLYEGEALVFAARLGPAAAGQDAGEVEVSGGLGGERWNAALRLDQAVPGKGVDWLWARRKVESLVDSLSDGADAAEVRGEVTGLALRHRLLTPYTSLVAIDRSPGAERAPSGGEPAATAVPLNVPYGWGTPVADRVNVGGNVSGGGGGGGQAVEECITVASESPLLDQRRISTGLTIARSELDAVPASADPWRVLARTPGVLTDRVNPEAAAGGPALAGPGTGTEQAAVAIDGFALGTGATLDPAGGLGRLAAEEVTVETAGGDAAAAVPGVRINLTTRRGTNEWRGSALAQGTGGGLAERRATAAAVPPRQAQSGEDLAGNRLRSERTGSVEAGGPALRDRLWAWATLERGSERWTAFGGQAASDVSRPLAAKLNAQVADGAALTLAWNRGRQATTGAGAGPDRSPETTLDGSSRTDLVRLQETQILSPNFYWDTQLGAVSSAAAATPSGGHGLDGAGVAVDAAGVAHGSWFAAGERRRVRGGSVAASTFFSTRVVSHELQFGGGGREELEDQDLTPAGDGVVLTAGEALGLPRGTAAAAAWREGRVKSAFDRWSLWAQDRLDVGRLAATLGLRYDVQTIGLRPSAVPGSPFSPLLPAVDFPGRGGATAGPAGAGARPRWQSVSPRLGGTWALGKDRNVLLRAAFGRYAAPLPPALAARLDPTAPASAWYLYDDPRGGLGQGPVVPPVPPGAGAGLRFWVPSGFDPARPGAAASALAPGLRPELTDEAVLGVEYEPRSDALLSLTGTWRRITGVLEDRLLVRDPATGRVAPAEAGDWMPAGTVAGVPGGGGQAIPWYDLRPGLAPAGGTLLVNGDRHQRYLGLTLAWFRRLTAGGWSSRGHLTWQDWTWQVGPGFARFADPTPTLALGQSSGSPVVERAGSVLQEPIYLNSRWSADASALVALPWSLAAAVELTARQGFPVGYFQPVARPVAGPVLVQASRRLDEVRYGDLFTLNARLDREILLSELAVTVTFEALNLLDAGTVLRREANLAVTRARFVDEVLAPRALRLGLRVALR
jgi:Ca-activated chloride channel homolog